MALCKKIELDNGLICEEAYIRIENILYFKGVKQCELTVNYYSSKPVEGQQAIPFKQDEIKLFDEEFERIFSVEQMNQENNNILRIGYNYLKTLPDFEVASDV